MEEETIPVLPIKAFLGSDIKRFDLSASCTFKDVVVTLQNLYGEDITEIKFKDEDDDLVTLSCEEEFTEALKSVPKTSGILKLHLNDSKTEIQDANKDIGIDLKEGDLECIQSPQQSGFQRQDSKLRKKQKSIDTPGESDSADGRKSSVPHKIASAKKLSKDLKLISYEVTGRIPVSSPASVFGLDTHFTSQKPGCRKVRHLSSNSSIERKQSIETRSRKKRKHMVSTLSSSSSSSSSTSYSSSSDSSSEDVSDYQKFKRPKSPTTVFTKMLNKFEKKIQARLDDGLKSHVENLKNEITSSVTQAVLQHLNGAVIQSIETERVVENQNTNKRLRHHHSNVICDHCDSEIFGPRYKCGNCSDYDLCEKCEEIQGIHVPSHVFLKIHYPSVHAGRNSIGGKAKPLLTCNIYEEREKEREKEELLQRKFDSGSELSAKTLEKIEKQRIKMKEAQRKREAREERKEEWKKVKKELRKNNREITRKLKQAKFQHKNGETIGIQSLTLTPAEFTSGLLKKRQLYKESDQEYQNQQISYEQKQQTQPQQQQQHQESKNVNNRDSVTLQDENVMKALSGLKIVETTQDAIVKLNQSEQGHEEQQKQSPEITIFDSTSEDEDVDEEIIITETGTRVLGPPNVLETSLGPFEDLQQKPDLVDFDNDVEFVDNQADEFIVVSKIFDLNTPLDQEEIIKHLHCDSCNGNGCHGGECTDFMFSSLPPSEDQDAANEPKIQVKVPIVQETPSEPPQVQQQGRNDKPMFDLVASVPLQARTQPDIASCVPEPLISIDEPDSSLLPSPVQVTSNQPIDLISPIVSSRAPATSNEDQKQPSTPTQQQPSPVSPVVVKQPEPMKFAFEDKQHAKKEEIIMSQPTLHDEILNLQKNVERICATKPTQQNEQANSPKTLLEQAAEVTITNLHHQQQQELPSEQQKQPDIKEQHMRQHQQHHEKAQQHIQKNESIEETLKQQLLDHQKEHQERLNDFLPQQQEQHQKTHEQMKEQHQPEQHQPEQHQPEQHQPEQQVIPPTDIKVEVEQKDISFGEVLTDAMASVVDAAASAAVAVGDTVMNAVNHVNKPSPTAEYKDGDVNVILPSKRDLNDEEKAMMTLFDMGFFDRDLNMRLLKKHNNDVNRCVSELLQMADNQWYNTRH